MANITHAKYHVSSLLVPPAISVIARKLDQKQKDKY